MYGEDPVPVSPGGGGAHNWSPMSYNPQTGLVYIPSRGWDTYTYAVDYGFKPDPNRTGGSGQTGLNLNTRGMKPKPPAPAIGPEPLDGGTLSTLVAWDPVKQEIRWRVPVGNSRYGGTVTTASNLVFQVSPDGRLIAYSADKGEKLFERPTGMRNGMAPPITFAIDGKQYIALMGGSGGVAQSGRRRRNADGTEAAAIGVRAGWEGRAASVGSRGHAGDAGPALSVFSDQQSPISTLERRSRKCPGLTPIGRATARLLNMNAPRRVELRNEWLQRGE